MMIFRVSLGVAVAGGVDVVIYSLQHTSALKEKHRFNIGGSAPITAMEFDEHSGGYYSPTYQSLLFFVFFLCVFPF